MAEDDINESKPGLFDGALKPIEIFNGAYGINNSIQSYERKG